jgi:protein-L-isoaspartate(D-aspartate) O-methyltransferase
MPLRGIADDARRLISLIPDGGVTLQTHREQVLDATALHGVLDQPRSETWTGVKFRGPESQEWMDLWLTCTMAGALSRMPVTQTAIDSGVVKPQFSWGCMAVTENSDLAYLTLRPVDRAADGGRLYEIGVIGHGPGGDKLATRVMTEICTWNEHYRSRTAHFEIQPAKTEPIEPIEPAPGRFVFDTALNRLVITWR